MKILRGEKSFLMTTIKFLQIFGIVPCVVKDIESLEGGPAKKVEVSQLMWIWCILLRVFYVVGFSLMVYDIMAFDIQSYATLLSVLGVSFLYHSFPFTAMTAPLRWKSNILLLNNLIWLDRRASYPRQGNRLMTKVRAVFVFSASAIFLHTASFVLQVKSDLFRNTIVIFFSSYFLAMVGAQILFFECSCSTLENSVPGVTSSLTDIKTCVYYVKKVRIKG